MCGLLALALRLLMVVSGVQSWQFVNQRKQALTKESCYIYYQFHINRAVCRLFGPPPTLPEISVTLFLQLTLWSRTHQQKSSYSIIRWLLGLSCCCLSAGSCPFIGVSSPVIERVMLAILREEGSEMIAHDGNGLFGELKSSKSLSVQLSNVHILMNILQPPLHWQPDWQWGTRP